MIENKSKIRETKVLNKIEDQKNIGIILNACDNKKAFNFTVLDVSKTSSITDYFIICSANNERQTVAIADEVLSKGYEQGIDFYYQEGFTTGRWILLECDNIIVHIFHRDEREIYDLESLWLDNNSIDVEQYGIKNWK